MNNEFCEIDGEVIPTSNLIISKAIDFANAVENSDYASLVECRRTTSDREIIVFDAKVQIGQKTFYKIKKHERLAVVFEKSDTIMPEVLALRKTFPLVPHVNLRAKEFPRSLCVTEQRYSESKLKWTASTFVENIRHWLASAAKGTLHAEDQPLEPLLLGSEGFLVLPYDLFAETVDSEPLFISIEDSENERKTYIAKRPEDNNENSSAFEFVAFSFLIEPQAHGLIRSAPTTLFELHEFLENSNADLLGELRNKLKAWKEKNEEKHFLTGQLALIIRMLKTRDEDSVLPSEIRATL